MPFGRTRKTNATNTRNSKSSRRSRKKNKQPHKQEIIKYNIDKFNNENLKQYFNNFISVNNKKFLQNNLYTNHKKEYLKKIENIKVHKDLKNVYKEALETVINNFYAIKFIILFIYQLNKIKEIKIQNENIQKLLNYYNSNEFILKSYDISINNEDDIAEFIIDLYKNYINGLHILLYILFNHENIIYEIIIKYYIDNFININLILVQIITKSFIPLRELFEIKNETLKRFTENIKKNENNENSIFKYYYDCTHISKLLKRINLFIPNDKNKYINIDDEEYNNLLTEINNKPGLLLPELLLPEIKSKNTTSMTKKPRKQKNKNICEDIIIEPFTLKHKPVSMYEQSNFSVIESILFKSQNSTTRTSSATEKKPSTRKSSSTRTSSTRKPASVSGFPENLTSTRNPPSETNI